VLWALLGLALRFGVIKQLSPGDVHGHHPLDRGRSSPDGEAQGSARATSAQEKIDQVHVLTDDEPGCLASSFDRELAVVARPGREL
jgi:hypothetical protein